MFGPSTTHLPEEEEAIPIEVEAAVEEEVETTTLQSSSYQRKNINFILMVVEGM